MTMEPETGNLPEEYRRLEDLLKEEKVKKEKPIIDVNIKHRRPKWVRR